MSEGGKKLFTPGPLGVSQTTRQAMMRDLGSRDTEFINIVKFIRNKLLEVAGVSADKYSCVLMQGSGTFSVEAVLSTTIPRKAGKVLVIENGAYGKRICQMVRVFGAELVHLSFPEDKPVDIQTVAKCLETNTFTNVAIVHCETSSGMFNSVTEVGALLKKYNPDACYFVDAMSSFGAVPLDIEESNVHFLVSSANKCIEGVPGFAYAIAQTDKLLKCKDQARSLSLDLVAQYEGLENNAQFRFTPPTHVMLAFKQALGELEAEGGVLGRAERYKTNNKVLQDGMRRLGFRPLLDTVDQGYIITSYHYPKHPKFNFQEFYQGLSSKGQVIYPGKVTNASCFRIGNIGHLFPEDMEYLIECIGKVCAEMDIPLPLTD